MTKTKWHVRTRVVTPALATFLWLGAPAISHAAPAQNAANQNRPADDATRQELAQFDQFLDSHREIAEQVRRDPSLVNNEGFVKNHPALQTFLADHPGVRDELHKNPTGFMRAEEPHQSSSRISEERVRFDQFLDSHKEISEQLHKNPSLLNDKEYLKNHAELETYLNDHPGFQEQVRRDPYALMRAEDQDNRRDAVNRDNDSDRGRDNDARRDDDRDRQDADNHNRDSDSRRDDDRDKQDADNRERDNDARRNDRDNDAGNEYDRDRQDADNRGRDRDNDGRRDELASFDRFLDSHREIAEQIRKNPSLANNDEFVKNHPPLQAYLQQHPGVRTAISRDPNAFMQQEARYDQYENRMRGNEGEPHRRFGEFLGGHSNIAGDLSRDPSLVKNQEYMENHPELKQYLGSHPDVQKGLMDNPATFIKSSQQFTNSNESSHSTVKGTSPSTAPATDSKPKP
jgi:hypothetical protein